MGTTNNSNKNENTNTNTNQGSNMTEQEIIKKQNDELAKLDVNLTPMTKTDLLVGLAINTAVFAAGVGVAMAASDYVVNLEDSTKPKDRDTKFYAKAAAGATLAAAGVCGIYGGVIGGGVSAINYIYQPIQEKSKDGSKKQSKEKKVA